MKNNKCVHNIKEVTDFQSECQSGTWHQFSIQAAWAVYPTPHVLSPSDSLRIGFCGTNEDFQNTAQFQNPVSALFLLLPNLSSDFV